jgi:hypothetical protein
MANEKSADFVATFRLTRRRIRVRSRRAVSDVVATILLLALTVVLFSAIFAFVTSFPSPPAQNSNQFQAQIIQGANASNLGTTQAVAISILHLAGPPVPASALIYLKSSVYPLGPEFTSPYTVADGGVTGSSWNLGQTWYLTSFAGTCAGGCNPILPDNITVYILSGSALLFSAIIPGSVANTPPTFLSVGITPSVVAVGEGFTVSATISGVTSTNTVKLTDNGVPGLNNIGTAMTYSSSTGTWTLAVSAGLTTTSGSYYAFITASNTAGATGTAAVPITVTSSTTQIATAISMGTGSYAKCTGAKAPAAACQASGDFSFSVTITSSLVTFGSLLFEVYTTSSGAGAPLTTVGHSAFAIAPTTALTTADLSWVGPATGPLLVTLGSSWTLTYGSGISGTTALTTSFVFSMDVGTTQPSTTSGTLSFIVLGTGPYSGQSAAVALPAS